MKVTEKHLKKKFSISTKKQLLDLMQKKDEDFFKQNLFAEKQEYIQRITTMMKSINETAEILGDSISMTRSGSIVQSWAAPAWGELMASYKRISKHLRTMLHFLNKGQNDFQLN